MPRDKAKSVQFISSTFLSGFIQAIPIILGYLPIGIAYGILATKVGLSTFNTLVMSLIVYAGSAQFIAVGLFLAGSSPISIVLTTFVVNLRHLLMSASLSTYLKKWKRAGLIWFSYQITDETFGVHINRFSEGDLRSGVSFIINGISQLSWIAGTTIGILTSKLITNVELLGLDFALPAMFIGLLILQMKDSKRLTVAIISGLVSTILLLAGIDRWNVILATLLGATVGIVLEKWIKKKSF